MCSKAVLSPTARVRNRVYERNYLAIFPCDLPKRFLRNRNRVGDNPLIDKDSNGYVMSGFLPLFIDLHDRKVVIIGGGSVGERKATLFGRYARTVVVSREFTEKLLKSKEIERIIVDLKLGDEEFVDLIKDAFLVIPATDDPAYNEHLAEIAGLLGVLVNRVNDDPGDVIIPSVIARGDVTIGISTLGSSPALSRYSRRRIEEVITPEYGEMARLQSEMRKLLKERVPDQKKRQQILWQILGDEMVWEHLKTSYSRAYEAALGHLRDKEVL